MAQDNDIDKQNALRRCQCKIPKKKNHCQSEVVEYQDNNPCGIARSNNQNEIYNRQPGNPACNTTPPQYRSDIHSQSGSKGVKELLALGCQIEKNKGKNTQLPLYRDCQTLKKPEDYNTCDEVRDQNQETTALHDEPAYATLVKPRYDPSATSFFGEVAHSSCNETQNKTYALPKQQLANATSREAKCTCKSKSVMKESKASSERNNRYDMERYQHQQSKAFNQRLEDATVVTSKCDCKSESKSKETSEAKSRPVWERQQYQLDQPTQGKSKWECKSKTKEPCEQQQAKSQPILYQRQPQRDTSHAWEREQCLHVQERAKAAERRSKCVCKSKERETQGEHEQQYQKERQPCSCKKKEPEYQRPPCTCKKKEPEYQRPPCTCKKKEPEYQRPPCTCKKKKEPEYQGPCGTARWQCQEKQGKSKCRKCKLKDEQQSRCPCKCKKKETGYRFCDFWDYQDFDYDIPCGKKQNVVRPSDDSSRRLRDEGDDGDNDDDLKTGRSSKDTMLDKDGHGPSSKTGSEDDDGGKSSMDIPPVDPRDSPSKSGGGGHKRKRDKSSGSGTSSGDGNSSGDGKYPGGGRHRKSLSSSKGSQDQENKKMRLKLKPKPPNDCTVKKKGCQKKCPPPEKGKKRLCKSKNKTKNEADDKQKKSPRQKRTCCDDRPPLHWPKPNPCKVPPPPKKRKALRRIIVTHNREIAQLQQQLMLERAAKRDPYVYCLREQYRHCMNRC